MSRQVTATRTVTHSSGHYEGTALVLNTGHFKTCPGFLKILQLLCGIVTTGIIGHYFSTGTYYGLFRAELFFLLMSVFAMITTFCVILSMILSMGTSAILPRTFFEVVYHFIAFVLLCAASITLLVLLTDRYQRRVYGYEARLAAASIGLINSFLYLCTFILAIRSWRLA